MKEEAVEEAAMPSRNNTIRNWTGALSGWAILELSLIMPGSAILGQKSQSPTVTGVLAKCQQCHGETAQMSHLSVSSRDAILKGGDHGPAVIPGNAADSLL